METTNPIYYSDPQFGRLELNAALNWYTCKATWEGIPI
jgi:hypothetical protein